MDEHVCRLGQFDIANDAADVGLVPGQLADPST